MAINIPVSQLWETVSRLANTRNVPCNTFAASMTGYLRIEVANVAEVIEQWQYRLRQLGPEVANATSFVWTQASAVLEDASVPEMVVVVEEGGSVSTTPAPAVVVVAAEVPVAAVAAATSISSENQEMVAPPVVNDDLMEVDSLPPPPPPSDTKKENREPVMLIDVPRGSALPSRRDVRTGATAAEPVNSNEDPAEMIVRFAVAIRQQFPSKLSDECDGLTRLGKVFDWSKRITFSRRYYTNPLSGQRTAFGVVEEPEIGSHIPMFYLPTLRCAVLELSNVQKLAQEICSNLVLSPSSSDRFPTAVYLRELFANRHLPFQYENLLIHAANKARVPIRTRSCIRFPMSFLACEGPGADPTAFLRNVNALVRGHGVLYGKNSRPVQYSMPSGYFPNPNESSVLLYSDNGPEYWTAFETNFLRVFCSSKSRFLSDGSMPLEQDELLLAGCSLALQWLFFAMSFRPHWVCDVAHKALTIMGNYCFVLQRQRNLTTQGELCAPFWALFFALKFYCDNILIFGDDAHSTGGGGVYCLMMGSKSYWNRAINAIPKVTVPGNFDTLKYLQVCYATMQMVPPPSAGVTIDPKHMACLPSANQDRILKTASTEEKIHWNQLMAERLQYRKQRETAPAIKLVRELASVQDYGALFAITSAFEKQFGDSTSDAETPPATEKNRKRKRSVGRPRSIAEADDDSVIPEFPPSPPSPAPPQQQQQRKTGKKGRSIEFLPPAAKRSKTAEGSTTSNGDVVLTAEDLPPFEPPATTKPTGVFGVPQDIATSEVFGGLPDLFAHEVDPFPHDLFGTDSM